MEQKSIVTGNPPIGATAIEPESKHRQLSEEISIACHENEIPAFVGPELARLYGNVFSSLAHFGTYGGLDGNVSTYVVRKNGVIVTIFLYRCVDGANPRVQVLNEGMTLGQEDLRRFAGHIFSAYRPVDIISFNAIQPDIGKLPFPCQRFKCTQDIVLTLPESQQAYLQSLGRNMRRNIRRYMEKLKRSFPSFRYEFHDSATLEEHQVRAIIDFSRTRIIGKNKAFATDDAEVVRIIALARQCGFAGIATIDGRICGGLIGYRVGRNYFFRVIGHDPQYNDYSTGILCCYLTICECISRGGGQCNFMQNGYAYKFALGAVPRNLDHVVIYRSRAHVLRNGRAALKTAYNGYLFRAKAWLLANAEKQDGGIAGFAFAVVSCLRKLKQITRGLPTRRE